MQNDSLLQENVTHTSWSRFAALEAELESSKEFIEIHKNNYEASSDKYQSIVTQACAEIENIYQQMCVGTPVDIKSNISTYMHSITNHCKDFFNTEIHMPMHNEVIKPWSMCAEGKDPAFWQTYHAIQHEGKLAKATLEHAIYSLAGLFSLLLVLG